MRWRTLLLYLDDSAAFDGHVSAALAFAERYDAHVHVLFCIGELYVPGWADWPPHVLDEQREYEQERAERNLARFRERADKAGISHGTRSVRVPAEAVAEEVAIHVRHCDAAILGQPDPDEAGTAETRAVIEHVVLAAGRPVFVVPYIGLPTDADGLPSLATYPTVAWDAGREATRAVNDALPLIVGARQTELVTIDAVKRPDRHGDLPGADMATHLARHGASVEVQMVDSHRLSTAEVLLNRVFDSGSDCLIMGAYGHSRLRELILGGATREVLDAMTVPVLMSH
jgi:nucleotide-binding universal stress UspA family protein